MIGVKRGGTTSLFRDLELHPAMCPLVPSARRLPMRENMKGIHYFDSDMRRSVAVVPEPLRDPAGPSDACETGRSERSRPRRARTTSSIPSPPNGPPPRCPTTTFVIMLRDPGGTDHLALGRADPQRRESPPARRRARGGGGDGWPCSHDALAAGTIAASHAHEQQTYAAQSEYAASYERWARAVGTDRLVVIFSEDYYEQPAASLRAITDRLGIAPLGDDVAGRTATPPRGPAPSIPSSTTNLTRRFRPDVERLGELLGITPPWPQVHTAVT